MTAARSPSYLFLLLALTTLLPLASGLIYTEHKTYVSDILFYVARPFGLLAGGKVDLSFNVSMSWSPLSPSKPLSGLKVMLCTEKQAFGININTKDPASCAKDMIACTQVDELPQGNVEFVHTYPITDYNLYYILVLNCPNSTSSLTGQIAASTFDYSLKLTVLNPNGEHLTAGLLPMPKLYSAVIGFWAFVFIWWTMLWLTQFRYSTLFHRLISLFPLYKILASGVNVWFYKWLSVNGTIPPPSSLLFPQTVVDVLSDTFLYLILLALASGWYITRTNIIRDLSLAIPLLVVYTITAFAAGVLTTSMMQLMSWLTSSVLLVSLVVLIVVSVNKNLAEISENLWDDNAPIGSPQFILSEKQKILESFKQMIVLWVVLNMLVYFSILIFIKDWSWTTELLYEANDLIIIICLTTVLRIRRHPIFIGIPAAGVVPAAVAAGAPAPAAAPAEPRIHNAALRRRMEQMLQQSQQQRP